jgi:hypothetical protein
MSLKQVQELVRLSQNGLCTPEEQATAALKACAIIDAMDLLNTKHGRRQEGDVVNGFRLIASKYPAVCSNYKCDACIAPGELIWWRPTFPPSCVKCIPRVKGEEKEHTVF